MHNITKDLGTIDKIEETRKSNNNNWMNLLRLAYSLDPVKTKSILKDIIEKDKEVVKQFEELIK